MLPPPNGHIRARERSVRSPALLAASITAFAVVVGCQAQTPELNVTLSDYAFDPKQLSLTPGQKAVLVLQNKGTMEHNLDIPELRLSSGPIAPGQTVKLEVAGPARTYKLICTLPGHEEQGMVGELRVQRR
jgi:uncharacterized cupredoxin-like copper-binding protein